MDKNTTVACSALVSSYHLFKDSGKEVVRRWIGEVQETINNANGLVQYHALGFHTETSQR